MGIPNKLEFRVKVWINNRVLYDGIVQCDNVLGLAAHYIVLNRNRFLFVEICFPEDGIRFQGMIDAEKGRYIRFDKGERIECIQSKKPFKFR